MVQYLKRLSVILLILIIGYSCSKKPEIQQPVLVKIGDRVITTNEFIQRSEYTIRPVWCRGDDYVQRKVVLNSLIAEKLLAIEGSPSAGEWINNKPMQNYLQGRKEQEMRQLHYSKLALEKVEINPDQENLVRTMSERTYTVQILPINNDELAGRISKDLQSGITNFDALIEEFEAATGKKLESEDIDFQTPVNDILYKQLFFNKLDKDQVVGPVHGDRNQNFLFRVNGWTRHPVISDIESAQRIQDVKEKITEIQARDIYESWIHDLMRGKKLELNEPIFRKVTEAVGQDYFRTPEERKKIFKQKLWNENDKEPAMVIDDIETQMKEIADETIFTFEGENWTVRQFDDYLEIHPLVFRNRKMPKGEFAMELKNAIADLLRDKKITEDAYAKKLDQDPMVVHRMTMWKDNLIAMYERNKIVESASADSLTDMQTVEQLLNPVIEELQAKYSDQIEINTDIFEQLKLTSIDMFVVQQNVSFPVIVPQFPLLTTLNKLNYGQMMAKE
jgi:hypothetical protein